MSFDLSSLALKDTTELHLRHPVTDELLYADEDKKLPITVSLYGTASKQHRNAMNTLLNRQLKRGKKTVSAEVMREEGVEMMVAVSDRINNLTYQGAPVDNEEAFRTLYTDSAYSWLKDQVDTGLGDVGNFLKQQ